MLVRTRTADSRAQGDNWIMKTRGRVAGGAALLEGVIALSLIIGATILGALFLINSGLSIYYKGKLALVSGQAAQFAAGLSPSDPDVASKTQTQAQAVATAMGLPAVQVTTIDLSPPTFVAVTVTMTGNLLGSGDALARIVNLTDTGTASKGITPLGFYAFFVNQGVNNGKHGWVPLLQQPVSGFPTWRLTDGPTTSFDPNSSIGPTDFSP